MTQKRITMAMFGNETSFVDARLYDGIMHSMVQDILQRVVQGELTLVQAPNDDPAALQSHLVVTPKDLFLNQHEVAQLMGSPSREQQDQRNSQDSSLAGPGGADHHKAVDGSAGPDGLVPGEAQA